MFKLILCDIFDLPISTSIYHCSHLSRNGGTKVVYLIPAGEVGEILKGYEVYSCNSETTRNPEKTRRLEYRKYVVV